MKCPICESVRMREVEKNGVMIDVCPDCKGVWLDRGELDKLLQGIRELQSDYDQLNQRVNGAPAPQGGMPNPGQAPIQGQGYGQQGSSGGYVNPPFQPGQPGVYGNSQPAQGQGYGQVPPPQGGYGQVPPPNGQYGSQQQGYGSHSKHSHEIHYNKYGHPYKKKKTMFDVLGDLFE
ncbi:zf-TFIIB domain-containing protein [Paenibacillus oenotherae]|uniref:Zf-TFIIB domain-containing protein n=1 Tax=Paenibacillus oenotherae TaxID=1435645 RepID=A0ABS7DAS2_9BACL|nr:zf-TFIIB domain-containing protein [Paenibacillus oenotherae]